MKRVFCLTFETAFFGRHGFAEIEGTPVEHEVFEQLLQLLRRGRGGVPRPRAGEAEHPRQPPHAPGALSRWPRRSRASCGSTRRARRRCAGSPPPSSPCCAVLSTVYLIGQAHTDSPTYDEPVYVSAGLLALTQHDLAYNSEHPPLAKAIAALPVLTTGATLPEGHVAGTNDEQIFSAAFLREQRREGRLDEVTFASRIVPVRERARGRRAAAPARPSARGLVRWTACRGAVAGVAHGDRARPPRRCRPPVRHRGRRARGCAAPPAAPRQVARARAARRSTRALPRDLDARPRARAGRRRAPAAAASARRVAPGPRRPRRGVARALGVVRRARRLGGHVAVVADADAVGRRPALPAHRAAADERLPAGRARGPAGSGGSGPAACW